MKYVKYIDNQFYDEGVKVFQSLEMLSIYSLPSLEKLSVERGDKLSHLTQTFFNVLN